MTVEYPGIYPCPLREGFSNTAGLGLVLSGKPTRALMFHPRPTSAFTLRFIVRHALRAEWFAWVKQHAYASAGIVMRLFSFATDPDAESPSDNLGAHRVKFLGDIDWQPHEPAGYIASVTAMLVPGGAGQLPRPGNLYDDTVDGGDSGVPSGDDTVEGGDAPDPSGDDTIEGGTA